MFGFTVYSSITQAGHTGRIPLPVKGEKVEGGHAICTAGYDDSLVITNEPSGPKIRNVTRAVHSRILLPPLVVMSR